MEMSQKSKKKNKAVIILSILLGVSVLINLLLFVSIGLNEIFWEEDYSQIQIEWCRYSNDQIDYINSLTLELQSISYDYSELGLLEYEDCYLEVEGDAEEK